MNRLRQKTTAIVLAFLLGIGFAWAGLETVTHIQDLNASWPLGSDLASTSDDHIRNIKSALKTDFPNFNGTYTSASAPVFAIPSDTNTGIYSVAADDLGFSTGGALRFDISTTAFTGTLPWRGQDGAVGAPAFSFSGDTDTGFYREAANQFGVTIGGTLRFTWAAGNTVVRSGVFSIQDGSVGAPGLGFDNDGDTGFYRIGSNVTGVAGMLGYGSVSTPAQITADQNNYNPTGLGSSSILRISSDATRTITGLVNLDGGAVVHLLNVGSNQISLANESASSSAANRFALTGSGFSITAGGSVMLFYDAVSSRWRVLSQSTAG
jgi:hypothetical protein